MTTYFEHNAYRSGRKDVALDVVEFDMPALPPGIEVEERSFENTGEFLLHIARQTGPR